MQYLSRPLHRGVSRTLISRQVAANGNVRTLTTQCTRNWCPYDIDNIITTARQCRQILMKHTPRTRQPIFRTFSTTPTFSKSKYKPKDSKDADLDTADAADLTSLQTQIEEAVDKFKTQVSSLRTGGRFNPQSIESLRVVVDKKSNETVRLGDLAQVIPKGARMMTILAGDEEYIKPISSALTTSHLSLNPQPDSQNALQLNVPIPPPTKESRDAELREAKDAMETASRKVRGARADKNKALKKSVTLRPDDVRKALDSMEKIAAKGQKDVKDVFEAASKAIERG